MMANDNGMYKSGISTKSSNKRVKGGFVKHGNKPKKSVAPRNDQDQELELEQERTLPAMKRKK